MRNQYIGIDLHQAFFQACAVDREGAQLWEDRLPRSAEGFTALRARCTPESALAVEAMTPAWHFVDAIRDAVGEVCIVDPLKTKLKAGYAAKTDRLDARRLADALRRDSVVSIYYPPVAVRELRELCRYRHALVRTRTALVNRLRAVLLRQGLVEARRLAKARDDRWLTALALPPRARASACGLQRLLAIVRDDSERVDAEVTAAAEADPITAQLQQLRGIGPIIGLTIRAEVGDIRRFPTGAHLASYAGLVPQVSASASRVHYGRITRRGSLWLRWALVEAAIHVSGRTDRVGKWGRRLIVRKGALKARVAMARVLAEEVHRQWWSVV